MRVRNRSAMTGLILLGATLSPAWAQTSAPAPGAEGPQTIHAKKSARKKATASSTVAPVSDSAERAAALARERRNFFAHDKTDSDASPTGGPGGSSGAYLGGSSGLAPGMQFKF